MEILGIVLVFLSMNHREHNKLFRISGQLCLAVLLFAVSAVNASPTVTRHSADMSASLSLASTRTTTSGSINTVTRPINVKLADLGKEFMRPPTISVGLRNAPGNSVRLLPAVPATVLMLLTGFLCVSLYRDRKVWLTALAGLLWISQAGIQTFPQLVHHFSHKYHTKQQICAELIHSHYIGNSHRLRSDVEGTRYVGLLRHLSGIPDNKNTANLHTFQPAVIFNNSLTLQFHCPASKAEQFVCFSPAFIFAHLARGPPLLS